MINKIQEIVCEEPNLEIWKYLRYFHDERETIRKIKENFDIKDSKQNANIRKQAEQLSYCIQQAEEYYKAAQQVSLATKSLLLYYGSVALSQALILLKNDGTYSIDFLRKNKRHHHHGLDLLEFSIPKKISEFNLQRVLQLIKCKLHLENDKPWGQFAMFYRTLVPTVFGIKFKFQITGAKAFLEGTQPCLCADLYSIESLKKKTLGFYDLAVSLPDCYFPISKFGISPQLCEGKIRMEITQHEEKGKDGKQLLKKTKEKHSAFLDRITKDQKERLLAFYASKECYFKLKEDFGTHGMLVADFESDEKGKIDRGYYPDIVEDINGKIYYIIQPENYIHEPAAQFIILYCLGMLSRYYPDLWMKLIKLNIPFREFSDTILRVIERKFPNLILDQMTEIKHFIHK